VAPTDQYDPQRLINYGANRWAFKPEFGYSRRLRHWVLDGHAGVWFYTRNPEFFSRNAYVPIVQVQTQEPIMALEGRVSYDVKPRLWVSLDANFWFGGRTSLNGVQNPATLQERYAAGKALREACPRDTHAVWKAPAGRPDPVQLVLKAEKGRLPELLPLHLLPGGGPHHGMRPRVHPVTGVRVQCCGDAHLCNFGGFATPEWRVIFAINDLDETLPAPHGSGMSSASRRVSSWPAGTTA
jgi:hypothetical protein